MIIPRLKIQLRTLAPALRARCSAGVTRIITDLEKITPLSTERKAD